MSARAATARCRRDAIDDAIGGAGHSPARAAPAADRHAPARLDRPVRRAGFSATPAISTGRRSPAGSASPRDRDSRRRRPSASIRRSWRCAPATSRRWPPCARTTSSRRASRSRRAAAPARSAACGRDRRRRARVAGAADDVRVPRAGGRRCGWRCRRRASRRAGRRWAWSPALAQLARAARRGQPLDDRFAGPSLTPETPPLGRVMREPSPYATTTAPRLLYFAATRRSPTTPSATWCAASACRRGSRLGARDLAHAARRLLLRQPAARRVAGRRAAVVRARARRARRRSVKTRVRLTPGARRTADRRRRHPARVRGRRAMIARGGPARRPRRGPVHVFDRRRAAASSTPAHLADALADAGGDVTVFALDKDGAGFFRPLRAKLSLIPAAPAPSTTYELVRLRAAEIAVRTCARVAPDLDIHHAQDCLSANGLLAGQAGWRAGDDGADGPPRRALRRPRPGRLPGAVDPRR